MKLVYIILLRCGLKGPDRASFSRFGRMIAMRARMVLLPFLLLSSFALGSECVAQVTVQPHVTPAPQPSQPQKTPQEQAAEVGKYSGPGSCAASNCHGG